MARSSLRSALSLARWLGPWAGEHPPRGVARRSLRRAGAAAYVYEGPRALGVYLVVPGLHFLGADDPRLDRFCRVLAASGFVVVAPFITAFRDLVLAESAWKEARDAFATARAIAAERGLGRPAVFSISFGSALALDLATLADGPSAVLVFGGFCDFLPTVRFAVTGRADMDGVTHEIARDPLNSPVVFLNLLPFLDVDGDRAALADAWRRMVHRTWGKMHLKAPGARDPYAHAIASTLPAGSRASFLRGCMLEDGALDWLESGLARAAEHLAYVDPRPRLPSVRSPIVLVHGRDDDVIPYFESIKLARSLPVGRLAGLHLTGLYGHTGARAPSPREIARETATLARMLLAMAGAPGG